MCFLNRKPRTQTLNPTPNTQNLDSEFVNLNPQTQNPLCKISKLNVRQQHRFKKSNNFWALVFLFWLPRFLLLLHLSPPSVGRSSAGRPKIPHEFPSRRKICYFLFSLGINLFVELWPRFKATAHRNCAHGLRGVIWCEPRHALCVCQMERVSSTGVSDLCARCC